MSDFDQRLSAVLVAEADDAPHVVGLAQAARRRHVARRRRRVAAGGVAAVLAIAAPVVVLAGAGGGDSGEDLTGTDPTSTAPTGEWQTVEDGDVRAEIPGGWSRHTCDFDGFESVVYGPSQEGACSFGTYLAFYGTETFDPMMGPGVIVTGEDAPATWGGYVYAGDKAVSSSTEDRDLTRRILATARVAGDPQIEAGEWRGIEGNGIRAEIPAYWGLGPDADVTGYEVCATPGRRDRPLSIDPRADGSGSIPASKFDDGRWITVSAPTRALADLVLATVDSAPSHGAESGCAPSVGGG